MKKKVYLILFFSIFVNNCYSEQEECLRKNGLGNFQNNDDTICSLSLVFYETERFQRNRDLSERADSSKSIADISLIECLRLNYEKSQCNKKSDIIPASW